MTEAPPGLTVATYLQLRSWLVGNDPDAPELIEWSIHGCKPPSDPEDLAGEIVWIILCAGRSAQAARTIEARVWKAIREGSPVVEAFGYRAKAAAIESVWRERQKHFDDLQVVLALEDPQRLLAWCESLPYVGAITAYQLQKNLGGSCPKPDRWVSRFAGIPDWQRIRRDDRFRRCMELAQRLSAGSGDCVRVVDSLLYLAGNKGLLRVGFDPHVVSFQEPVRCSRSIYTAAG